MSSMKITFRQSVLTVAAAALVGAGALLSTTAGAQSAPTSSINSQASPAAPAQQVLKQSDRSPAPACVHPERARSQGFDKATRYDKAFNDQFRHCFTTVDGVQMHYVVGGNGPQTLVLLHGWPESWYEYRDIMPELTKGRTVVAIDLPGLGDSTGTPKNYAAATLATYVHELLDRIGKHSNVVVVGHDFGAGVAYPLAATYHNQVSGLLLMDFPLAGKNLKYSNFSGLSFHFEFNRQEPLAEQLVTGRVSEYLRYFMPQFTHHAGVPSKKHVDEYVRVYSRSQVLHGGFELYRNWDQNEADNTRLEASPLTIPVRLVTEEGFLSFMMNPVLDAAPHATATEVAGAGHWLPEEAPEQIVKEIAALAAAS
jgi:pimeloyl-ACP methyl ester carboxylesterase